MIRPEAKDQIMRWREVLIGIAAGLAGVWMFMQRGHLLDVPGGACVLAGIALIWIGRQRMRFRSAGAGPGSVQVDEGQIIYFGPLMGGAVDLRELESVTFDPTMRPAHWRFEQPAKAPLLVPVNADGAERLFDAFSTLKGVRMDRVSKVVAAPGQHPVVVWQSDVAVSAQRTLH